MPATQATPARATDATLRLDFAAIDLWAAKSGVTGDTAIGRLIGMDRITVWRYRTGRQAPGLDAALRIAAALGVRVEDIITAAKPPSTPPQAPRPPAGPATPKPPAGPAKEAA